MCGGARPAQNEEAKVAGAQGQASDLGGVIWNEQRWHLNFLNHSLLLQDLALFGVLLKADPSESTSTAQGRGPSWKGLLTLPT